MLECKLSLMVYANKMLLWQFIDLCGYEGRTKCVINIQTNGNVHTSSSIFVGLSAEAFTTVKCFLVFQNNEDETVETLRVISVVKDL